MSDLKRSDMGIPLNHHCIAVLFLIIIFTKNHVIISRLVMSVIRLKYLFLYDRKSSNTKEHTNSIVKNVRRQIPDAGITLDISW